MMPVKKLNRLPDVWGDLFYDQWPALYPKRGTTPQINVIETDHKFKIEIAAPGMTKDDFKVELNADNQLIVCLEKELSKEDKEKGCGCGDEDCSKDETHHYLRREFAYTSFRQIFNLPENVDRDNISAKMTHGVLRIKLPKRQDAKEQCAMKQIAIE